MKDKKSRNKALLNAGIFAAVFALTVWAVFRGEDMTALFAALREARLRPLLAAGLCVVAFIAGEAIILRWMMRSYGIRLRPGHGFLISSVGFFFSAVTPSAGGGQPMQVFFMHREKIPVPVSAVTLMVITITYKLVLIVIGIGVAFFAGDFLRSCLSGVWFWFYLGLTLAVVWVALLLILVFRPGLAKAILLWGLGLLEKLRILRPKPERAERLTASMEKYNETADYLKHHIPLILGVFIVTFLQRTALFSVTWFVCRALGLTEVSWGTVVILQATIAICADMLPLPGGMGISEGIFLAIFSGVFGSLILPGMILSRGLEYYTRLLISAIFSLAAAFAFGVIGRHKKEKEE